MPLVFAGLFAGVRLDMCAHHVQKHMSAGRQHAEQLRRQVQQLRYRLSRQTEYGRIEPRVRALGLHPARTEQVLAVVAERPVAAGGAVEAGSGAWLVSGLVELLGPAARAEAPAIGDSAGGIR